MMLDRLKRCGRRRLRVEDLHFQIVTAEYQGKHLVSRDGRAIPRNGKLSGLAVFVEPHRLNSGSSYNGSGLVANVDCPVGGVVAIFVRGIGPVVCTEIRSRLGGGADG